MYPLIFGPAVQEVFPCTQAWYTHTRVPPHRHSFRCNQKRTGRCSGWHEALRALEGMLPATILKLQSKHVKLLNWIAQSSKPWPNICFLLLYQLFLAKTGVHFLAEFSESLGEWAKVSVQGRERDFYFIYYFFYSYFLIPGIALKSNLAECPFKLSCIMILCHSQSGEIKAAARLGCVREGGGSNPCSLEAFLQTSKHSMFQPCVDAWQVSD